jgi:hypothetical protein
VCLMIIRKMLRLLKPIFVTICKHQSDFFKTPLTPLTLTSFQGPERTFMIFHRSIDEY